MAHEWHAGVLSQSSWHGLEVVETIPDAATLIRRGKELGAYPTRIRREKAVTATGLAVPGECMVGDYQDRASIAYGMVGGKYHPLDIEQWEETIKAAVDAGAKPAGAFALYGGARILATFEINGAQQGIQSYMTLVDSLDGSYKFRAGGTSIRVVCANTLSASFGDERNKGVDHDKAVALKHTKSINDRAHYVRQAIQAYLAEGQTVRAQYEAALATKVSKSDFASLAEALFPTTEIVRDKSGELVNTGNQLQGKALARAENKQTELALACSRAENNEGATLATVWNGATWMLDRDDEGNHRAARGGASSLESMLFGSRSERVNEIHQIMVTVLRPDGSEEHVPASQAANEGVPLDQIGRSILDGML